MRNSSNFESYSLSFIVFHQYSFVPLITNLDFEVFDCEGEVLEVMDVVEEANVEHSTIVTISDKF